MKLEELIANIDCERVNFKNVDVTGLSYNSKTTKKTIGQDCRSRQCFFRDKRSLLC